MEIANFTKIKTYLPIFSVPSAKSVSVPSLVSHIHYLSAPMAVCVDSEQLKIIILCFTHDGYTVRCSIYFKYTVLGVHSIDMYIHTINTKYVFLFIPLCYNIYNCSC